MKNKILMSIGLMILAVNGAHADYQAMLNRRAEDRATYHKYRSKAELDMFKDRYKTSVKAERKAKANSKAYTAWSKVDAQLFNKEMNMYKSGIRTKSFAWNDVEQASIEGHIR